MTDRIIEVSTSVIERAVNEPDPFSLRAALRAKRLAALVVLLTIMIVSGTVAFCGEARVQGDSSALRLDASQSKISDALSALEQTLNVRYSSATPLDRIISGTYSGSLPQVISRLLVEYNYWIKKNNTGVEIIIIGTRGRYALPANSPKVSPAESLASKWRMH